MKRATDEDDKVVKALTGVLSAKDARSRQNAALALAGLGPKATSALPALKKLFEDKNEDAAVRAAVAEAISKIPAR